MIQSKHCSTCYLIILTFYPIISTFYLMILNFYFIIIPELFLLLLTSSQSFPLIFSLHWEKRAPQNYDDRRLSTKQTLGVFLKCDQAVVKEERGVGRTCALVAGSRGASAEL